MLLSGTEAGATGDASRPVGVFDSGVGGLTVLNALRSVLPQENFIYLGDTARLPYGTKSRESIVRYSLQATGALVNRGIKCVVVACNTASSVAIEILRQHFAPLPVIGVVEPGAEAGCAVSVTGRIAVIATESTVREGAYQHAILRRRPQANVIARACPLFVALAEEGWTEGPIVSAIAHRYLDDLFGEPYPDTLVLGCTHFPVLANALREVVGAGVALVDSAATTAIALRDELLRLGLQRAGRERGTLQLLATDGAERFARVGTVFLGEPLVAGRIQLIDLASRGEAISL